MRRRTYTKATLYLHRGRKTKHPRSVDMRIDAREGSVVRFRPDRRTGD